MKVNKIPLTSWHKDNLATTVELDYPAHIVAVQVNPHKDVLWTIVHEAVHVWQKMISYIGEESPGIEAEAYTIEHIAKMLYTHYEKDINALHEKRKTRLQTGSSSVHEQTGSNQETV